MTDGLVAGHVQDKKDEGVAELVKQEVKGKNEADVDELVKLLQQHMAQPERAVRRAGGRRAPRTRSLCVVGELDKLSVKAEAEENNNNNNEAVQVEEIVRPSLCICIVWTSVAILWRFLLPQGSRRG